MNAHGSTNEEERRALEALRNGVPNRDAVRFLGCGQSHVTERFLRQLDASIERFDEGRQANGLLIAGDFGSGKSHLIEHLKHLALEKNFVCSSIVISKETPLFDPVKVFAAAADTAVAQEVTGDAIQEIALRLKTDSSAYADFFRWTNSPESELPAIFPATLMLHERLGNDPERSQQIRSFWSGESLPIADVRAGLRQIGMAGSFQVRAVPTKAMPIHRFRFVSRLMRAAGYLGWVLLIDEVELIGRYSRLQRARSYAELARWLGSVESAQIPGLATVAAITDDFTVDILEGKDDLTLVGPLLDRRNTDEYRFIASCAESGMREIRQRAISLKRPDDALLRATYETLKQLHADAYGWSPQGLAIPSIATSSRMRSFVRRWINEWDLGRLYPGESFETIETKIETDYSESLELEAAFEESTDFGFNDL